MCGERKDVILGPLEFPNSSGDILTKYVEYFINKNGYVQLYWHGMGGEVLKTINSMDSFNTFMNSDDGYGLTYWQWFYNGHNFESNYSASATLLKWIENKRME